MKRIYAFTLDSEDYPSDEFRHNLRLIAFLLYDSIYNYDDIETTALIINNKIKTNKIFEGNSYKEFYFEYDNCDLKYMNYEPFIIGERSFALTIDDEIMSEKVICELMDYVLRFVRLNYKYTVKSITYASENKEDERNRKKAVSQLYDLLRGYVKKDNTLVKKRVMSKPFFGKKVGIF